VDAWVTYGIQPPHNRAPQRSDGTLVPSLPQSAVGFPDIPGVTYNGIMHTGDLFKYGPLFHQGILSILPPVVVGTPYPVFVPKTDSDGNDIAGIRLPEISVPLATYTGWALRASAPGDPVPIADGCDAAGQRIPFAKTKADRIPALARGTLRRSRYLREPGYSGCEATSGRAPAARHGRTGLHHRGPGRQRSLAPRGEGHGFTRAVNAQAKRPKTVLSARGGNASKIPEKRASPETESRRVFVCLLKTSRTHEIKQLDKVAHAKSSVKILR
jgi:hypothetical protein